MFARRRDLLTHSLMALFKGYVIIIVTGISVERFLTFAPGGNIAVGYGEAGSENIRMKMSIPGLNLRNCCEKIPLPCRI